jgi:hypothetical protein
MTTVDIVAVGNELPLYHVNRQPPARFEPTEGFS